MRNSLVVIVTLAVIWIPSSLSAQGTVELNNYDSGMGIYGYGPDLNMGPPVPAPLGTFVQVLGGPSPGSMVPLLNSQGAGPIFTTQTQIPGGPLSTSFFDAGFGLVPGVLPTGTGWFQILAWANAPTYQSAGLRGQSVVWSQTVGPAVPLPSNGITIPLNIPAPIILVPEPRTTALVICGFSGLLALRCRR